MHILNRCLRYLNRNLTFWFLISISTLSVAEPFRVLFTPFPMNIPPYAWMDNCSNRYIGAIPTILKKAADQANIDIRIYRFDQYLPNLAADIPLSLQEKRFDAVTHGESKPGDIWSEFSRAEGYLSRSKISAIVHQSQSIKSLSTNEMRDLTAIVVGNRAFAKILEQLQRDDMDYVRVTNIDAALELLLKEKNHYILLGHFFSYQKIKENSRYSENLKVIDYEGLDFDGFVYLYGNPANKNVEFQKLNASIASLYDKGYWDFITSEFFKKWFKTNGCETALDHTDVTITVLNTRDFFGQKQID